MLYIERDVSWMYFNHRILCEARRQDVPLLERFSFLGIYSNNLDEFFRVRVATLGHIAESTNKTLSNEKNKAAETLRIIRKLDDKYSKEYINALAEVKKQLEENNIIIVDNEHVNDAQVQQIKSIFHNQLSGNIQPVMLHNISQLIYESDDSIYLAVEMDNNGQNMKRMRRDYAIIKLPVQEIGRFIRLSDDDGKANIIYLDDVVRYCLPWIFSSLPFSHFNAYAFKFNKDAEMELDNEVDISKMQKVQKGLKSRKAGEPLRISYDASMPTDVLKRILKRLRIKRKDAIQPGDRYPNHKDLMAFPDCGRKDLKYPKWTPIQKKEFNGSCGIIESIRQKDLFLHVPYHSFEGYLRFLSEAAISPQVKSIKTTLYRLATHSKVVDTLICAAKNNKKVTVVIELLARFDEANNIYWSKKMTDAGIEVVFGLEGLKIHSKITLIEMNSGNIACIGTGNFHEGNAKVYTDCMLFTAYKPIVKDIENVFNFIQSPFKPVKFKELLVSPNSMRNRLLDMISNEIKNKKMGRDAYIRIKINNVTDVPMMQKLFLASEAGVKIDMLVRGNCCLKIDNEEGKNIRIRGIIDRYLEHSRILVFCNNNQPKYYIGSADWMPRNLDYRIEVMTPVYNPDIQQQLDRIIDYGLRDTKQARIVDGTGADPFVMPQEGEKPFRSQEELYEYYKNE